MNPKKVTLMIHNKAFLLDPRDSDVILLKFSFDGKKKD